MSYLEFLRVLCDVWGYRVFVGMPVEGYEELFKYMVPEYMHYIPTLSANIALNIAAGVSYGDVKSVLFIDSLDLSKLTYEINELNSIKCMDLLIITNGVVNAVYNEIELSSVVGNLEDATLLKDALNILILKDGDLHA